MTISFSLYTSVPHSKQTSWTMNEMASTFSSLASPYRRLYFFWEIDTDCTRICVSAPFMQKTAKANYRNTRLIHVPTACFLNVVTTAPFNYLFVKLVQKANDFINGRVIDDVIDTISSSFRRMFGKDVRLANCLSKTSPVKDVPCETWKQSAVNENIRLGHLSFTIESIMDGDLSILSNR